MSGVASILVIWTEAPLFRLVQMLIGIMILGWVIWQFASNAKLAEPVQNGLLRSLLGPILLVCILMFWGLFQTLPLEFLGLEFLISPSWTQRSEALGTHPFTRISSDFTGTFLSLLSLLFSFLFFAIGFISAVTRGLSKTLRAIYFSIVVTALVSLSLYWAPLGSDFVNEGARLRGPLGTKNEFAALLALGVVLGMAQLAFVKGSSATDSPPKWTRFLEVFGLLFIALAFSLTESRGAGLALIASVVAGTGVWFFYHTRGSVAGNGLPLRVLAPVLIAAIVVVGISVGVSAKFARVGMDDRGRGEIYQGTLSAIEENWIVGTGMGSYADAISPYQVTPGPTPAHAHNDYLETILTFGLPAAAIGFALLIWLNLLGLKVGSADRTHVFVLLMSSLYLGGHSLIDHPAQSTAVMVVYCGILGACVGKSISVNLASQ